MVRDEPFLFYGLCSLAPYVNEILVVDTGSKPELFESIVLAQTLFPCIQIIQIPLEDAHKWTAKGPEHDIIQNVNENVAWKLGDIRRAMHKQAKYEVVWVLDGDEIYNDDFSKGLCEVINQKFISSDDIAIFLPFIDLLDKDTIRHKHRMGRIFKKSSTDITDRYPLEMHFDCKRNKYLTDGGQNSCAIDEKNGFVYHYEHLVKPWRKLPNNVGKFEEKHPEVFEKYRDLIKEKSPIVYEFMKTHRFYD